MKFVARVCCALIVAAIFAGVMIAVIAGLFALIEQFSGHRMIPRGAGWGIAIIVATIGGLKAGFSLPDNLELAEVFWGALIDSKLGRASIVLITVWIASWSTYAWFKLKPYDPNCYEDCDIWSAGEWTSYVGILAGGPIVLLFAYIALRWIKGGK